LTTLWHDFVAFPFIFLSVFPSLSSQAYLQHFTP
jgi:hypothetical protein